MGGHDTTGSHDASLWCHGLGMTHHFRVTTVNHVLTAPGEELWHRYCPFYRAGGASAAKVLLGFQAAAGLYKALSYMTNLPGSRWAGLPPSFHEPWGRAWVLG